MKSDYKKIEISMTNKEAEIINTLSQQCRMTNGELVKTLLFDSGILGVMGSVKKQ